MLTLALNGCALVSGAARPASGANSASRHAADVAEMASLQECLAALHPSVGQEEARRAAVCAYDGSRRLAKDYRLVRPPLFHNLLVNIGLKKRGLCYHWAEDLAAQLEAANFITMDVRWAVARVGTFREHNSVVVTAKGQPFEQGLLLDAWRRSGRLYWTQVKSDRYPWEESELAPLQPASDAGEAAATDGRSRSSL